MSSINPHLGDIMGRSEALVRPVEYYLNGIIEHQDYLVLAEAITLLESDRSEHIDLANKILQACEKQPNKSRRIGITGTPGVGKSTFIDSMTPALLSESSRGAVLTIDPTSTDRRGSILGDKTRMNDLVQNERIFIRPSPSRLHLGGAHEYTHEAICMCEAAGIDLILIETVGVGQSEHEIRDLVDCTLLLLLPGAGDDLQGIKKGITEIADIVIIHKADGDRQTLADRIQKDYIQATHLSKGRDSGWVVPVLKYSSMTRAGQESVVSAIDDYFIKMSESGNLINLRNDQDKKWLSSRMLQLCTEKVKKIIETDTALLAKINNADQDAYGLLHDLRHDLTIKIEH